MFVHLKQSGELLAAQAQQGELWTPSGVITSAEKIAAAFRRRERIDMHALAVISGAGNIVRGDSLKSSKIANGKADLLGRLATLQNTIVLASSIQERGIDVATFVAETMHFGDGSIEDTEYLTYDIDAIREAVEQEKVIMIAGGTGEDDKTTDNSVLAYGARHAEEFEDQEILILKGTKFDGVYDADPAQNARATRYSEVTAGYMLEHYEQMPAVDKACLEEIQRTGLALRMFRDGQHDLSAVIEHGRDIGTLIVQGDETVKPIVA